MSRLEKIKQLDNELKESLKLCASEGLSDAETCKVAAPVLEVHKKWRRKERLRTFLFFAVVVAVVAALYQSRMTSEFISAVAKLGMVKLVLPYWDWRPLHQKDCIFNNPYRVFDGVTEEDCKPLAGLTTVEREDGMSQERMAEDHLFPAIPVIITDAMTDWRAVKEIDFDHDFITKLYHEDPVLSNTSVCSFSGPQRTLHDLLDNLTSMVDNFQQHWGHCKLPAAKVLRTFYKRPYFMPGMVEADTRNFLALGKKTDQNTTSQDTVFEMYNMQMTWFSQVKGQFRFRLYPNSVCRETCIMLEGNLQPGETLVYVNNLWELYYSTAGEGQAVAIISGGSWSD